MARSLLSCCRYHAWVNVEALLEACFIGIVAAKQDDSEEEATEPASSPPPSPPSPPPAEPTAAASASPKARIVWDEKNLAANDAERGVAYGTLKIDQPETPFLYGPASRPHRPPTASMAAHAARHVRCATRTDRWHPYSHSRCRYYEDGSASRGDDDPNVAIHSKYLPELRLSGGPHAEASSSEADRPGRRPMAVEELQVLLGLLKTDENGEAILEEPKYTAAGDAEFQAKRQV
jgi:hypothetical protein